MTEIDNATNDVDVIGALRRAPLFAGLASDELQRVATRLQVRMYARDEVVFEQGDHADELLVVVWGELTVSNAAGIVARLRAGDVVGELALLLDEARSATVTCSRAACALVLDRELFRELVRGDPRVLTYLTQLLSRRAFDFVRARPATPTTALVAVVADVGVPGASLVSAAVAAIAPAIGPRDALLIRVGRGRRTVASVAKSPAKVLAAIGGDRCAAIDIAMPENGPTAVGEAVAALLRASNGRFRIVVIDVQRSDGAGDIEALRQWCDSVVHVASSVHPGLPGVVRMLNRRHPSTPALPINTSEPFVLPDAPDIASRAALDAAAWLVAHPHDAAARVLFRLTRSLLGASVGIALGAGAAFGLAHIGVVLELEEAGVPIDLVAGTSMGSIVAIGLGAGLTGPEMHDMARRLGNRRTALSVLQPSLSGTGLLSSKRLSSLFLPLIQARRFTDLVVPTRVVSMDVGSGERIAIGEGLLDDAFRASCAIPLVFAPSRLNGRTLVDGAMTDPVPADVAREMGADLVIGVNVAARPVPGASSIGARVLQRINPFTALSGAAAAPGLIDVLMSTLQVIQFELGEFRNLAADVRTTVDLTGFSWIEFHRALELVEKGRETGAAIAGDINALLADRLA
ncbi:MAG: cyclic nucleotide-binding and patatin-like phospholipase domain-containing protein [Acidimicrobiales bacterium]|nr:cyclic nucleotide-binding and patatin-like phospholipase domain-containing protein [Acidimicrobiales bacterium]